MRALARTIAWLTGLPLALLVVLFAVANRQPVALELWPVPGAVELPIYLAVLGALAVGLVVGAAVVWLSHLTGGWRRHRAAPPS